MLKRVLVVDTDPSLWDDVRRTCQFLADIYFAGDFQAARRSLSEATPDILVTNLRLGAYNGLHLVHLASIGGRTTRSIVYSHHPDLTLIGEAQKLGAFFELPHRLASALPAYLRTTLPPHDRRSPLQVDRRHFFRGGRRAADVRASA